MIRISTNDITLMAARIAQQPGSVMKTIAKCRANENGAATIVTVIAASDGKGKCYDAALAKCGGKPPEYEVAKSSRPGYSRDHVLLKLCTQAERDVFLGKSGDVLDFS